MTDLTGKNVLITGASMGIGTSIAYALAAKGANLILFARTASKLTAIAQDLATKCPSIKVITTPVDIQDYAAVSSAITSAVQTLSGSGNSSGSGGAHIDILINNAGLALGTPNAFPSLSIQDITQMNNTNINGYMFSAYAVLNSGGMLARKAGTILNITSTTALEVPPFPGEAVYHANKACQEGFTNALRNELVGTNIRVLALRPGAVATNFHEQRVGYDRDKYEAFFEGMTPLEAGDVARSAVWMLEQPEDISVKALDVVCTAQRSLTVFDRTWNERNKE